VRACACAGGPFQQAQPEGDTRKAACSDRCLCHAMLGRHLQVHAEFQQLFCFPGFRKLPKFTEAVHFCYPTSPSACGVRCLCAHAPRLPMTFQRLQEHGTRGDGAHYDQDRSINGFTLLVVFFSTISGLLFGYDLCVVTGTRRQHVVWRFVWKGDL